MSSRHCSSQHNIGNCSAYQNSTYHFSVGSVLTRTPKALDPYARYNQQLRRAA